jgi:hypothetical protein
VGQQQQQQQQQQYQKQQVYGPQVQQQVARNTATGRATYVQAIAGKYWSHSTLRVVEHSSILLSQAVT